MPSADSGVDESISIEYFTEAQGDHAADGLRLCQANRSDHVLAKVEHPGSPLRASDLHRPTRNYAHRRVFLSDQHSAGCPG